MGMKAHRDWAEETKGITDRMLQPGAVSGLPIETKKESINHGTVF